jgi:hypothetical protein
MSIYGDFPFEFLHSAIVDYVFTDENIEPQSTINDDTTTIVDHASLVAIDKVVITIVYINSYFR